MAIARMCCARQPGCADRAPAEPPASGEAQCADGEVWEEKGSAACRVLSRGERAWRPGRECGCPVRGHTVEGEAERCYTGNVPCETRLLHMRPMRNPGVAWGVDPLMQH